MGLLKVGPRSAGSKPGPVCYGLGGAEPTVTDADLHLGYLDHPPVQIWGYIIILILIVIIFNISEINNYILSLIVLFLLLLNELYNCSISERYLNNTSSQKKRNFVEINKGIKDVKGQIINIIKLIFRSNK